MKAIVLEEFGGPEQMKLAEVDVPMIAEKQLLIDVKATSVNRPDIVQREGNYPPPKGDSTILGLEVAGTVAAIAPGVTRCAPGDRVMALVGGGGYAEQVMAWEGHVIPIPDSMSFNEAAGVCETYITAWLNIFEVGGLKNGEAVLLHGGGGGVNTAGIQLVRALAPDSTIYVTASPGKVDAVKALGVDHVIDYKNENFADVIKKHSDGRGVSVVLDHIGADYLAGNMKSLEVGGRLVVIGVTSGIKAELNLALMMVKRQQILGSVLRSRSVAEKAGIIERFTGTVLPLFADRRIEVQIDSVLPLENAGDGHRAMQNSQHFGKIVLSVAT